jgi:hypothetical protein
MTQNNTEQLPQKKNGWGGARPGSGKQRGHPTMRKEILQFRDKYPLLPVEYFLQVLNERVQEVDDKNKKVFDSEGKPVYKKFSHDEKMKAAEDAAPYVHCRLASIEVSGPDGGPVKHAFDLTKLSDEELAAFEKIAAKAQILTLSKSEYDEVPSDEGA